MFESRELGDIWPPVEDVLFVSDDEESFVSRESNTKLHHTAPTRNRSSIRFGKEAESVST
jgi:hypothetical protein